MTLSEITLEFAQKIAGHEHPHYGGADIYWDGPISDLKVIPNYSLPENLGAVLSAIEKKFPDVDYELSYIAIAVNRFGFKIRQSSGPGVIVSKESHNESAMKAALEFLKMREVDARKDADRGNPE